MASAAVLAGVILAAKSVQDFPSRINTTAAALSAQANERFAANPDLLPLCNKLYDDAAKAVEFSGFRDDLTDAGIEVLAFFLAGNKKIASFSYVAAGPGLASTPPLSRCLLRCPRARMLINGGAFEPGKPWGMRSNKGGDVAGLQVLQRPLSPPPVLQPFWEPSRMWWSTGARRSSENIAAIDDTGVRVQPPFAGSR